MRFLKYVGALLLAVVALMVLALALIQPEAARLVLGFSGWRWSPYVTTVAGVLAVVTGGLALLSRWRALRITLVVAALASASAVATMVLRWPDYPLEAVRYPAGDAELAGEYYRPQEPTSAVVVVHGSAAFPREFYDLWADFLARRGTAVLLVDKRGAGDSGGVFVADNNSGIGNLSRLAEDVCAGVAWLRERDPGLRVGVFGISQGGWTGVLAARRCDVEFMVYITGPTVSVGEEGVWSDLRGDDEQAAQVSLQEARDRMTQTPPSGYDPRADLALLDIPGLWLFGDRDNSIPSAGSMQVLDQLKSAGKPYDYENYAGVGHILIGHRGAERPLALPAQSWRDLEQWLRGQRL